MKYTIYQMTEPRKYLFMSWDFAKDNGFSFGDYKEIYNGSAIELDDSRVLESLFEKFNLYHPKNFTGHSLSVSDIVKLTTENNSDKYYYCDFFGWEDITDRIAR